MEKNTPKKLLEKPIEDNVCRYARSLGVMSEKFTSPSKRSVPDRLVTFPRGNIIFIEFKATGKVATPKQLRDHERRRALGCTVYVCDDIKEGRAIIDKHLAIALGLA